MKERQQIRATETTGADGPRGSIGDGERASQNKSPTQVIKRPLIR